MRKPYFRASVGGLQEKRASRQALEELLSHEWCCGPNRPAVLCLGKKLVPTACPLAFLAGEECKDQTADLLCRCLFGSCFTDSSDGAWKLCFQCVLPVDADSQLV